MNTDVPVADTDILDQTRRVSEALRRALAFCRQLQSQPDASPADAKSLEDFIFMQTVEIAVLTTKVTARLAAYREVVTAANQAILDVDAEDHDMAALLALMQRCAGQMEKRLRGRFIPTDPDVTPAAPLPSKVIVFTGSYRPQPANDASAPGGVA